MVFVSMEVAVAFVLVAFAVVMWIRFSIVRCPKCGHYLLVKPGRVLSHSNEIWNDCPNCGYDLYANPKDYELKPWMETLTKTFRTSEKA